MSKPIALVTGGSSGIGAACCETLAEAGFRVAIHYRSNETRALELRDKLPGAFVVRADLSQTAEIDRLVEAVKAEGDTEVLVNNAGVQVSRPLPLTSLDDYHRVVATNMTGLWYLTKKISGGMIRRRRGRIINISSVVGARGSAMQSVYAMTKAAVDNLTKSLAMEYGVYGILVNGVSPGLIDTAMTREMGAELEKLVIQQIPLGRKGKPEEVAEAVRFLAVGASYCSGTTIHVNGGLFCA